MTQEILAKGICSPSELSKIETGSRNPTKEVFIALMDAMGVNGHSFFTLYSKNTVLESLKKEVREAADFGDIDHILECLDVFRERMDDELIDDVVYYNYTVQSYYRMCGYRGKSFGKTSLSYLDAIHPGLLDNMGLFTCGLTRQERALVNGIGLGFMDVGEFDTAISFFKFLYFNIKDTSDEVFEISRTRAVSLNNIALALVNKQEYLSAEEVCVTAYQKAYSCGDMLRSGILLTYVRVLEGMEQYEKARKISEYIRYQDMINGYMKNRPMNLGMYNQGDGMILI